MIVYEENPKEVIKKKCLELRNDHNKVVRYKINIWKSIAFLYTSNEKVEFEIKNTILFTLALQKAKYLGIKLIK